VTSILRRIFPIAVPVALAVVLSWHPPGGDEVFEGVRHDVGAWLFVHTAMLLLIPLLGLAGFLLLRGLEGLAASVSRVSLVFFLVFYTAYEVTVGIGTGLLVDYANGLPTDEQAVVAGAIQDYNENAIVGDPASFSLILGFFGWVVAMLAAAVAFQRAGAGWPATVLIAASAIFAVHPPPIGPAGLVCFAVAAVLIERRRGGDGLAPARRPPRGEVAAKPIST
jgi:hypothetical protein